MSHPRIAATALLLLPLLTNALLARSIPAPRQLPYPVVQFPAAPFIENIQAFIKDHPNDDNAYLALARIHTMAFSRGEKIFLPSKNDPNSHLLPTFDPLTSIIVYRTKIISPSQAIHLKDALAAYNTAVTINPANTLAQYGLYSLIRMEATAAHDLPPEFWGDQSLTPKEKADCDIALKHLLDPNPKNLAESLALLQDGLPKTGPFLCNAEAAAITAKNKPLATQIDNLFRDYYYLQALPHARAILTLVFPKEIYNADHDIQSSNPDDSIYRPIAAFVGEFLRVHPELAQPNEMENIRVCIHRLQTHDVPDE